jgi:predicted nucleic acid-binding protein
MIFLETSFLINYFVPKVQNHKLATEIMKTINENEIVISEMVIYETLTVLRKLKQNTEKVNNIYNKLTEFNAFEDIIHYEKALELTLENKIGFFDNLSYIVMKENNIKTIASYDPDFDIFKDIKRIH